MSRSLQFEWKIFLFALLAGLPGSVTALLFLWWGGFSPKLQWTLWLLILGVWLGCAAAARSRAVRLLQILANLLEALREGDYSQRGHDASVEHPLGQVMLEINTLSATLHQQRLGAEEATALLGTVIEEIDVAVFAFDSYSQLKLVNRAGEKILVQPEDRLLERSAEELGLAEWLEGRQHRTVQKTFPGGDGRWRVRRSNFRLEGQRHELLVITDMSRALREEERQAWQRLIRVLGHELNNTLTPIKSIAGTMRTLLQRRPRPHDWEEDVTDGLQLIGDRAQALSRFIAAYSKLARLPAPVLKPVGVGDWIRRVAGLETRSSVRIEEGPEMIIQADSDQIDQLLINLVRNAVDACLETGGEVLAGWRASGDQVEVWVQDEGPGLPSTDNLFVPFFTTKPGGTGIGLVLSRQIAEAHGGSLSLANREEGGGCIARLRLPV